MLIHPTTAAKEINESIERANSADTRLILEALGKIAGVLEVINNKVGAMKKKNDHDS